MEKEIKILQASWRDFPQVMHLEKECFPLDVWPMLDIMGVLSFPWYIRLKAMIGGKVVGFAAGETKKAKSEGWISTIGVLPEYQGMGIGKKLLTRCETELDVPCVKLSVRESSHGAVEFYKSMGYKVVGHWKRYYKGGEDALVMEKQFK